MKRKGLIFGGLGVVAVATLIAVGLREQSGAQAQLARARESARRNWIPLTAAEFKAAYPVPPESENAWPIYRQAIALASPGSSDRPASEAPSGPPRSELDDLLSAGRAWRRGQFTTPLDERSRVLLRSLAPVFELIRKASEKPILYLDKDWSGGGLVPMPEISQLMRLSRLALLDATDAAVAGNFDRYVERIKTISQMAHQLGRLPLSIGAIVACSIWISVADSVQQHLSMERLRGAHAARLEALVAGLGSEFDLRTAIRGYSWMTLATLDVLSSREKIQALDGENRFAMRNVPKPEQRYETERRVLADVAAILGRWPKDREDTLGMRAALGDEDLDIWKALEDFSPYFRSVRPNEPVTEGALSRMVESYENFVVRKRLCLCLFGLLAERSRTGAFPSTLPNWGAKAIDPFSGAPFVYRPQRDGFTLYSLGTNRTDDGGVDVRDEGRPADIVVRFPGGASSL